MFEKLFGKNKNIKKQAPHPVKDTGLVDGIKGIGTVMQKGEQVPLIELTMGGNRWHLRQATMQGDKITDLMINKAYGIGSPPVQVQVDMDLRQGDKFYAYLCDEQTGMTCAFTRVGNITQLRTNAYQLGTVVKSNLIQSAWAIKLELRYILAFILGGVLFGGIGGLVIGGVGVLIIVAMLG